MHVYETRLLLEDPAGAAVARQVFGPRAPCPLAPPPGVLAPAHGGTGTGTAFTPGSVIFATTSGVYAQDNANLSWDDAAGTLKVLNGTSSDQLRLGTSANYYKAGRNTATGALDVTGTQTGFVGLTVNGPLSLGNTSISSGFYIDVTQDSTAAAGFRFTNNTSGSNAQIQCQVKNDLGALAYYGITSSAFNVFAPLNGGRAFWVSYACPAVYGSQDLQPVVFTQNGAEVARLDTAGKLQAALKTKAGTPTDADFVTPTDGMVAVDTAASKIWVRVSGTWKSVTVA